MRYEIMLHQISPERLRTMRDPMKTMQLCQGMCKSVPDEVCDAVFDSLKQVPGVNGNANERDTRAQIIALRMATEGWRFCPCFPTRRTQQHERIFSLVHTNLANRLAHNAVREMQFSIEKQSAA
jgi:hypothetical protein